MQTDTRRRSLLKAGGLGLLLINVDGAERWLSPRVARAETHPYRVLDATAVVALEAFGETLLPGAAEAGLAHYIDYHLSVPAPDSLLLLRYLDAPPPYAPFYQAGLAALDNHAQALDGMRFSELTAERRTGIVSAISAENPAGWQGPPAPLFYFAVRADAVDVVYGTVEGFEKLGVPYMPHILPPSKW